MMMRFNRIVVSLVVSDDKFQTPVTSQVGTRTMQEVTVPYKYITWNEIKLALSTVVLGTPGIAFPPLSNSDFCELQAVAGAQRKTGSPWTWLQCTCRWIVSLWPIPIIHAANWNLKIVLPGFSSTRDKSRWLASSFTFSGSAKITPPSLGLWSNIPSFGEPRNAWKRRISIITWIWCCKHWDSQQDNANLGYK